MNWHRKFQVLACLIPLILMHYSVSMGQENAENELVDRMFDGSAQMVVLNDLNVVVNDITTVLTDLGYGSVASMMGEFVNPRSDSGIANERGVIIYADERFSETTSQFEIRDAGQLRNFLDAPDDHLFSQAGGWFDIADGRIPVLDWAVDVAMVSDGQLWVCEDGSNDLVKKLLASPKLTERLDLQTREIINESGITFVGTEEFLHLGSTLDVDSLIRSTEDQLTDAEQEWLVEFAQVVRSTELAMAGLKYQSKVLEIRSRALIEDMASFDGLFELAQSDRDWRPDLGLEPERLVVAGAIQMDAFRSSAGARVVPQTLLTEFGKNDQLKFLQGNMLGVLFELASDSWNELDAGRVALYQNKSADLAGQLAIIGVVDCEDPETVMTELGRLSLLTRPRVDDAHERQLEQEIARLIEELSSDNINTAARAETRLVLSGSAAIPAVEIASRSTDQCTRSRATRTLHKLKNRKGVNTSQVADPQFWTTLKPGLRLIESRGTFSGFPVHTVEITPDSSKTPAEVEHATSLMAGLFGKDWSSIQFVQVQKHYVFMIGSNRDLLKRIIKNVNKGSRLLTKEFENVVQGDRQGQLQIFLNSVPVKSLLDTDWPQDADSSADQVCWMGLSFEHNAVGLDALIPVRQLISVLMMVFQY